MEPNNSFKDILTLNPTRITVHNDTIKELFLSHENSFAIHVVITKNKKKKAEILGYLAEQCRASWKSLNTHLNHIESLQKLFPEEKEGGDDLRKLVIFQHPIFSQTNDGKKTTVANFFMDVLHPDVSSQEFTVLCGIAAALASSVVFYVEGDLKVLDLDWLLSLAAAAFRTKGLEQFQKIYFLSSAWDNASEFSLGPHISSKPTIIDKALENIAKEKRIMCEHVAQLKETFLLHRNFNLSNRNMNQTLRKFSSLLLTADNIKKSYVGLPLDFFEEDPLYQQLFDFENESGLEKLIEIEQANEICPDEDISMEEITDDPNFNLEDQEVEEEKPLPWESSSNSPKLSDKLEGLPKFNTSVSAPEQSYKPVEPFSINSQKLPEKLVFLPNINPPSSLLSNINLMASAPYQSYQPQEPFNIGLHIPKPNFNFATKKRKNESPAVEFGAVFSKVFAENKTQESADLLPPFSNKEVENAEQAKPAIDEKYISPQKGVPREEDIKFWLKVVKDSFLSAQIGYGTTPTFVLTTSISKYPDKQILQETKILIKEKLSIAIDHINKIQDEICETLSASLYFEDDEEITKLAEDCIGRREKSEKFDQFEGTLTEIKLPEIIRDLKILNAKTRISERSLLKDMCSKIEEAAKETIMSVAQEPSVFKEINIREFKDEAVEFLTSCYGIQHLSLVKAAARMENSIDEMWSKYVPSDTPKQVSSRPAVRRQLDFYSEDVSPIHNNTTMSSDGTTSSGSILKDMQAIGKKLPEFNNSKLPGQPIPQIIQHSLQTPKGVTHQFQSSKSPSTASKVAIRFGWQEITVIDEVGNPIFPSIPSEILITSSEITLGLKLQHSINISEIVEAFIGNHEPHKKLTHFFSELVKIFAILFLKLHYMICNKLKCLKIQMGIFIPSVACSHLSQILVFAANQTGLHITLADQSACIISKLVDTPNYLSLSKTKAIKTLVLDVQEERGYCTAATFIFWKGEIKLQEVVHEWNKKGLFYGQYPSYINVIKKIPDTSNISETVLICEPNRNDKISSELAKNGILISRTYSAVSSATVNGIFKLMNPLENKGQEGILLAELEVRMVGKCKHDDFLSENKNMDVAKSVQNIAKRDNNLFQENKRKTLESLYERMRYVLADHEKKEIAAAISRVEDCYNSYAIDSAKITLYKS